MDISGAGRQPSPTDVRNNTEQASGASAVATVLSKTVSVVEEPYRKAEVPSELHPQSSHKKKKKAKGKVTPTPKPTEGATALDLSSRVARDKAEAQLMYDSVLTVRGLGERAQEANRELYQFETASPGSEKLPLFMDSDSGLAVKLSGLAQECADFCESTADAELFSSSISHRVKLRAGAREIYFEGKCRALIFLGNYNGISVQSMGAALLTILPYAVQAAFLPEQIGRDTLGQRYSETIVMYLDSLKYFNDYLDILHRESPATPADKKMLRQKMSRMVNLCYRQASGLLCVAQDKIAEMQDSKNELAVHFPGEPLQQAFKIMHTFYGHFAKTSQGKRNEWLWGDRFFIAPESPEEACTAWCFRTIAGIVSGHFDMAQSSMKALSDLCRLPEDEGIPAYADFQKKKSAFAQSFTVACGLSMMISRTLPVQVQNEGILEVQRMRKMAMDYLADVKCWWTRVYPPGTDREGDARHHQLDQLISELEKEVEGTVQRALAVLATMSKVKKARKKPDINLQGLIDKFERAEVTDREPEPEAAKAVEIPAHVVARQKNQEDLKQAAEYLQKGKFSESRKLFSRVANSNPQNTTTEQRIWANYGVVELQKKLAKGAFDNCSLHIEFLQGYEASLKQNRLPDFHEGRQFQPELVAFREEFKRFSINLSIMNSYIQGLSKILLTEDTSLIQESDLHLSLDMIKTECCAWIQTLNEFAERLDDICERRKALLLQAGTQGRAAGSTPFNYKKEVLDKVAGCLKNLGGLLTEFESGFESHCQAVASGDSSSQATASK